MQLWIAAWLVNAALGAWVFRDAQRRALSKSRAALWALAVAIFAPIQFPFYLVVAIYLTRRPLQAGEIRKGGWISNALIRTAGFQSLFTIGVLVLGYATLERKLTPYLYTESVGLFLLTFFVAAIALLVRDRSEIEEGVTRHPK